ncbi:MAG: hypothetical protein ACRCSO_09645 [Sphingomonas sp.]
MVAAIEFGLFLGALAMIGWVFAATLMPALPRIIALLTGEAAAHQPSARIIVLAPGRRAMPTAPVWRAAA